MDCQRNGVGDWGLGPEPSAHRFWRPSPISTVFFPDRAVAQVFMSGWFWPAAAGVAGGEGAADGLGLRATGQGVG